MPVSLRLAVVVACAVRGYLRARSYRDRYGRTPWGWPPAVWALVCALSLLLGLVLMAIAERSLRAQASASAPWAVPTAPPPGWPATGHGSPPYGMPAPPPWGTPAPPPPYGTPAPPLQYGSPVPPQYRAPAPPQHGTPAQPQWGAPAPPQYGTPVPPQYGTPAPPQDAAPAEPSPQPVRGWSPTAWHEPGSEA